MRSGKVLALASTLALGVVFVATLMVLSSVYRQSMERGFDRRLGVHLNMLLATLPPASEGAQSPRFIGDPLFELPVSGWYWQVTPLDRGDVVVATSKSLWDRRLPHLDADEAQTSGAGFRHGYISGPEQQRLRLLERTVDVGAQDRYLVAVAGDAAEIDDQVSAFRLTGAAALALSLILVSLALFCQVRLTGATPEPSLEPARR